MLPRKPCARIFRNLVRFTRERFFNTTYVNVQESFAILTQTLIVTLFDVVQRAYFSACIPLMREVLIIWESNWRTM